MNWTGRHLSLFSGIGMTDLAAEAFGFRTLATAEIDPFNRSVLEARFPAAHHFSDVKQIDANALRGLGLLGGKNAAGPTPKLVTGGFPCQDLSAAGLGAGLSGARSGLWVEFARIIGLVEPEYVLIENVAVLRSRGLDAVLNDLHFLGYDAFWDCIPAAAVGAPHMRDRIWIQAVKRQNSILPRDPIGYIGLRGNGVIDADHEPLTRLPRAGKVLWDRVYEVEPRATQRMVKQAIKKGEILFPTPCAQEPGWTFPVVDKDGNPPTHPNQRFHHVETGRVVQKGVVQVAKLFPDAKPAHAPLWPTPTQRDYKDTGDLRCVPDKSLLPRRVFNVENGLWPTPTRSDGTGGPGTSPKRTGGKNLRTKVAEAAIKTAPLNPDWVEWMMGLPEGWSDPRRPNYAEYIADDSSGRKAGQPRKNCILPFHGWQEEPPHIPRVREGVVDRAKRIRALGNGLVPQVAGVVLCELLQRVPTDA